MKSTNKAMKLLKLNKINTISVDEDTYYSEIIKKKFVLCI